MNTQSRLNSLDPHVELSRPPPICQLCLFPSLTSLPLIELCLQFVYELFHINAFLFLFVIFLLPLLCCQFQIHTHRVSDALCSDGGKTHTHTLTYIFHCIRLPQNNNGYLLSSQSVTGSQVTFKQSVIAVRRSEGEK